MSKTIKILLLIIVIYSSSCGKRRLVKHTINTCVSGHYEEYETVDIIICGKTAVPVNRVEEQWVCDEYRIDTIVQEMYVLPGYKPLNEIK